jgi:tetratricopeptide (TPR) repeat protein
MLFTGRFIGEIRLESPDYSVKLLTMNLPHAMQTAIDALKRHDYAAARAVLAGQDLAAFAVPHFLAKGLAESMMKDWEAAAATFAAATDKFPGEALLWLNRGVAQENLGQNDAAIQSHERCLALLPDQADAQGNLANLYRKKRRYAEAEAAARRALALGADASAVYNRDRKSVV